MKTMMKPMLLMAAALVVVVFIVFCTILFWIKSNHGLQWVQSRVNTAIPGTITIERHRLSLLRPSLGLYGVVLHDPQGLALAGFTHLAVRLDWWALWRRELRLEHILLQAPWADLTVHEAPGLNLMTALVPLAREKEADAPPPDDAGLPFNIVFKSIQLTDGRFTFTPLDDTTRLETTGITLSADGNLMARSGSLDLDLASVRFSTPGIHPEPARIALKARLNGDKLNVSTFDVTTGRTTLRLSGSADDLYTAPMVDSVLSVDSRLAELKAAFDLDGDYTGSVNAKLTLKGALANPDAGLVLAVDGGRIAGQPLDHGDLSINLQDRQVTIDPAAFRLADGAVILNGTVNLRKAFPTGFLAPPADANAIAYSLTLVQDIPDLNPWLKPFIEISGKMTGRVSITGNGVIPSGISTRLTLNGSGQGLLAPGMDRPVNADVNLSARMDRGKISITHLNAAADGVELSGNGSFQMDGRALSGNLSLTADDLSRALAVVGMPSVNGTCNAALTVDGSLNQPQFSVDLASKNLHVDTYTLGDLTIDADMDHDGLLNLHALTLQNQESRIQGNGRLRLLADGGGIDPGFVNALNLTLEKVSAANFTEAPPIDGILDGRLQLGGPLASLTGELSLNASALNADVATIGNIDARMRLDAGTVFVDRLHLLNQDSTFNAAGKIQLLVPDTLHLVQDPPFDFTADSDHLDPGDFIDTVNGDFTFKGMLTGSVEKPVGRISLTGGQVNLAGQSMETISLDARFENRRLWLDRLLAVVAPGEQIEGGGWVDLDKTVDLHVKSDGISTSRIQRLHEFFPGEGMLQVDVTAQGRMDNPDIDGHLTVSDIIINDGTIEDVNLTFSLHDMLVRATGNLNFEMDKDISLIQSDRMALKLAEQELSISEFELAVLSSGSIRLKGDARFGGRLNMDINGRIPLAAAGVFSDENGRIHLTADTLRIDAVSGFLDTGSFRIDGTIDHEKFTPTRVKLAIDAKSLPLEVPDTLTVLLNGDIKITGNERSADARGEIVLLEGVYYKDVKISLLKMATTRQRAVAPATRPVSVPYFDTVNLDIVVGHRQPFMVQNNMAQLEISPDLKIGGSLAHPIVSGRAQVKDGTVTFQKKTFDVKKGVIDFVNPYKTEADIDIESETRIRIWTIKLAIKGTPDNLDLQLSSVPAETDSDILSLILFGRTARELTAGEGGAQRTTGQIMAEMIADTFGDDIKKTTGIDILQLESNGSSDGEDDGGVKVTVGKHLSDRMTVKYAVETKDGEITQRAITEYKLLEHILVSGFQDTKGVYGSELVFRIEFR
ncbi:MAG: translocation/assembly module TamB domain-containing protein [Desulfosarcina sp.]|nr:translocation/assembly module TamB domain-containing protein [Desulfosarcina sp.]MBC2765553.1 hypothetical protein [Desulfosarcina sp.]